MFPLHPLSSSASWWHWASDLLIGIDRERKKRGEGPDASRRRPAYISYPGGRCWVPSAIVAGGEFAARRPQRSGVVAFAGLSYWRAARRQATLASPPRTALVLVTPASAGWRSASPDVRGRGPWGVVTAVLLAARSAAPIASRARRADRPGDPQPPDLCRRHPGGCCPCLPDHTNRTPTARSTCATIWIVVILVDGGEARLGLYRRAALSARRLRACR